MEDRTEKPPESKSEIIFGHIISDLGSRPGFRQEYDRIDEDVLDEIHTTLAGIIETVLNDPQTPKEQKPELIIKKTIDDLSDRRGIRQGFFDQLFYDDEAVTEYLQDHPGAEVSESESRTGVARQLVERIKPFI